MILIVRRIIISIALFLIVMAKNSEILKKFGKRVIELRIQKGFTSQMSFALKAKLDRTYVGGIERGERNVIVKEIDLGAMMAGTQYRGMFESRLKTVLDDAEANAEIQRLIDLASSTPRTAEGKIAVFEARKEIVRQIKIKARDAGKIGESAREWLKDWDGLVRNRFEKIVSRDYKKLSERLRNESVEVIYFIDEVHTIIGAGNNSEGGLDASNMLKPLLASGKVRFIAATTKKEKVHVMKDGAFYRRFESIEYGNATLEELELILKGGQFTVDGTDKEGNVVKRTIEVSMPAKKYFEYKHGVQYTDEAIDEIIRRAIAGDPLNPEKSNRAVAIDLMDSLGSAKKVMIKNLVGAGASEADISRNNHRVISADYVTQNYNELTINKPIKQLRAELSGLMAEIDWLMKPMTGNSYIYPDRAEVEKRAEGSPVVVSNVNDTAYVVNEQGNTVRFTLYVSVMKAKIAQAKEDMAALRGLSDVEQKGLFGNEKRSELNVTDIPQIRKILAEIKKIKSDLGMARVGSHTAQLSGDATVQEEIALLDLNSMGDTSRKDHETIAKWVERLINARDKLSSVVVIYDGKDGIRENIAELFKLQSEWERMQSAPRVTDADLGLTTWDITTEEEATFREAAQKADLNSPPSGSGRNFPDYMHIPVMSPDQSPQDYLKLLKQIVELSQAQVKDIKNKYDNLITIEARYLMEHSLSNDPLVKLIKAMGVETIPEHVRQIAARHVYSGSMEYQPSELPKNKPNQNQTAGAQNSPINLTEMIKAAQAGTAVATYTKLRQLSTATIEKTDVFTSIEKLNTALAKPLGDLSPEDRCRLLFETLDIYKDQVDKLAEPGFRNHVVAAVSRAVKQHSAEVNRSSERLRHVEESRKRYEDERARRGAR